MAKKPSVNATTTETPPQIVFEPSPSDVEWTDFVLGKMTVKEKFGNRPKCDGLRRVFGAVMGDIVESMSRVVQAANIENANRCTVEHTIRFIKHGDTMGRVRVVTDCVDISTLNTSDPFSRYPTASAGTIAEGRALKKALCLVNVQTAEEMNAPVATPMESSSPIKPTQKNIITKSASDQNISLDKMLKEMFDAKVITVADISRMSYTDAQVVINQLSRYDNGPDNGGDVVPDSILAN